MNTTAKIIITLLTVLVVFFGIYSFIKANEAEKMYTMLLEEQQISLTERSRAQSLSELASISAAEAMQSAAMADMTIKGLQQELQQCKNKK
jgi:sortase (surface protein transpeptidase)